MRLEWPNWVGVVLLAGALHLPAAAQTAGASSPLPPGAQLLWADNFSQPDTFRLNIDRSVGCDNFPANSGDLEMEYPQDAGSASVLQIVANPKLRSGLFLNASAGRSFVFSDNRRYVLEGYFKKPSMGRNRPGSGWPRFPKLVWLWP